MALPLLACGDGPGPCHIPTCEYGIHTAALQSGSVEWLQDGVPILTADVAMGSPGIEDVYLTISGKIGAPTNPEPLRGHPSLTLVLVFKPEPAEQTSVDGGLESGGVKWQSQLTVPTDPRDWSVGEVGVGNALDNEQYPQGSPAALAGGPACSTGFLGATAAASTLHIVVEDAVGGPADFPLVVTPDYARIFRLEYDGVVGICEPGLASHVSLRLTQTAADFSTQQEPCYRGCR